MVSRLKSLKSLGAFDGEKEKADIPRDVPLPRCKHEVQVISGSELRCTKCHAGWSGPNIILLKKLLTS